MSQSSPLVQIPPEQRDLHRFAHDAMATTFEVIVAGQDRKYAKEASAAAFEELDRLECDLSRFIETSDVTQINCADPGAAVAVGPATFECLQTAQKVAKDTKHAFDVNFRGLIPYELELNEDTHEVMLLSDGIDIDLGGIAKGYAIDQMVALLKEWSIERALVHSGSSTVYALGQQAWTIGLRDPKDPEKQLAATELANHSLSGSSAVLYGTHIVDGRDGGPAEGAVASWAKAPTAALSDALSTAFMVLSPDEVKGYCQKHPETAAALLVKEGRPVTFLGQWD